MFRIKYKLTDRRGEFATMMSFDYSFLWLQKLEIGEHDIGLLQLTLNMSHPEHELQRS